MGAFRSTLANIKIQIMKGSSLIYVIVVFLSLSTSAQKIEGLYKVDDINLVIADIGQSFSFEKNETFRNTTHEHLEQKTISGGYYEVIGDTLKLHYTRIKPSPPDPVNILQKERLKLSDTSFHPAFSNIKVYDSNGKPQAGVHLILRNEEKKHIMAFASDSSGNFPSLNLYDEYIADLHFSFLGHEPAYLKTDSLFNYQTEIEVKLNDSSLQYDNTEQSFSYLIKKASQEKIELIPLKGDEKDKLTLIRIE